ncbi:CreA family protein [Grimontia sp. S25]|uniref:CreA family protein n=1 Tax=Grimontia sedimenti TaxID=2711294 RepID=A0A6M1RBK1_9GAMM|nr:CreA family protein [Grimontia sedimenti]NGN97550.1 CreA family protein [Grimontia sedimenti]
MFAFPKSPTSKPLRALIAASVFGFALAGCSDDEVGDVSLGLFTTKDIKIQIFNDPEVPGVTCHISHVKADLDFSDPSDMGISCRQTGEITPEMIANVDRSKSGEVVFTASKSILFKSMKIRRIFDSKNQTLMYLSYSTKETQGSHKHSLSTVPLWGTKAWQAPTEDK